MDVDIASFEIQGSWERKGSKCRGKERTDFIGCILLHCWSNMTVGVEGESCGVVSEQPGEGFHIHTVL